jgi:hypothetical protein
MAPCHAKNKAKYQQVLYQKTKVEKSGLNVGLYDHIPLPMCIFLGSQVRAIFS